MSEPYPAAGPAGAPHANPYQSSAPPWQLQDQSSPPDQQAPDIFPGTDQVDIGHVFSGPGYNGRLPRTDPVAIFAIIVAAASAVPFVGLVAIAVGVIAVLRLRAHPYQAGRNLAWAAIAIGGLTSLWWLWIEVTNSVL